MTILKWISIIVFLLLILLFIITALASFFTTLGEIIKIFRKYPEISRHLFDENSYEKFYYGGYKRFKPYYTTKEGAVISVSERDGRQLYYLKNLIEILLFALIVFIFTFGAYNTISLLLG